MNYFMHRIQRIDDTFNKGIEVHETLDSAILSFWGRIKLGYNRTENNFVSCKITDENGIIIEPYNMTWLKESDQPEENRYFLHHIRKDGNVFDKNIEVYDSIDDAFGNYASYMEYGYNNPLHPNVTFVSCYITDLRFGGMVLKNETWTKQTVPEPEPELAG